MTLTPDYRAYVRSLTGMTYDERAQWKNLGVHLTRAREARIVNTWDTYAFLEDAL